MSTILVPSRRAFLKIAAAAPLAGTVSPAMALEMPTTVGGGVFGGALGGCLAQQTTARVAIDSIAVSAAHAAFDKFEAGEDARTRWIWLWRRARITARRQRQEPEPAKLVIARDRLLQLRRRANNSPSRVGSMWLRRMRRIRAAMKRAGFPGMPWELDGGKV